MRRILSLLPVLVLPLFSQTVKDREGSVRADRAKMSQQDRWIYNDVDRAFEIAQQANKPVLVVLRCVPCLGCSGLDSSLNDDPALVPLLDQFVCLRLINVNSLDLSRFQFDYDLSLSALILNADGTTYGRFGSWVHQKNPELKEADGLQASLTAALTLHKNYPANKASLASKQPKKVPYKTPLDMPAIAKSPRAFTPDLDWQGKVVQSCLHCHQIGDAVKSQLHQARKPIPLFASHPFPSSDTIGIQLSPAHRATVRKVLPASPADRAGLQDGDEILSANGAPLISPADFSWALHHLQTTNLDLLVKRNGKPSKLSLKLPSTWRLETDISRRVGTWPMRAWIGGGMKLKDLTDKERDDRGIPSSQLALMAEHVGQYGEHAAAKRKGFKKGDIIIQVGKHTKRLSESKLFALLLKEQHTAPTSLKAKVLRNGKEITLSFPIQ